METFLLFLLAISVLVLVHELGHFWAAKKSGVVVEEFGLGYPPRLWAKKKGGTVYSLNLLPVGGFVRLRGEEPGSAPQEGSFQAQPLKNRFLITIGGVVMNLLLAVFLFSVVYGVVGVPQKTERVKVVGVAENSPAQKGGLRVGDEIVKVEWGGGAEEIETMEELVRLAKEKAGEQIVLVVAREGKVFKTEVVPRKEPPAGEGPLGIAISQTEMTRPPWWQIPWQGTVAGFREAFFWGRTIVVAVGEMLWEFFWQGKVPQEIAGPVGIYQATSVVKEQSGFWATLHFFGVLSVNLAVINLIPFPALDGSRVVFLLWEAVFRRRPPAKLEKRLYQVGMALLLALLLWVTISDLRRLFSP